METRNWTNEYLGFGWSILPVKPNEKRPLMAGWQQYTVQRPDAQTVNNWFNRLSGVGVGAVTGRISGIVVLDVEATCPYSIDDILSKYPTDRIARSGGGGYHLYYSYPLGENKVPNRVRVFDGADIRADGGFIVLPPTRHPSGNQYQWVREGPLGAFPMGLLDQRADRTGSDEGWLKEALRGVSEGARNDTCARLAGYFFKKGINGDVVEALLLDWNKNNTPPMPAHEVIVTVRSIERFSAQTATQAITAVAFEDDVGQTMPDGNSDSAEAFDVVKIGEYVREYGGNGVQWLVEDWLPDKSVTFLVSPPESYKTWLLLDLAVSVASGTPFLGKYNTLGTGPALIIQQEDSHEGLTDRIVLIMEQKLGEQLKIDGDEWQVPLLPDLPIYIHPSRRLRFDNPQVLAGMEAKIAAIRPKVVLIDPLYSAVSSDNYMSAGAEQMMVLKAWRDKYGCSFVLAHHSKKNVDPDSTAREDSWGSQFLNAFLEAGWQIRRNQKLAPNEIVVRRHSKVMGNQAPISLTFDISTQYPLKYEVSVRGYEPQNAQAEPVKPAQHQLLAMMLEDTDYTQAELCNVTGKTRSTISRQIKQLEAAGSVVKMPNGRFRKRI